jgi:transcriptional regulator with XRE-family HTH domain
MNPTPGDIGEGIRRRRKEKGLTLAQMAELCECSSSLLSQIETGVVNPSLSALKAISDALDVPMASLFEASSGQGDILFSLMESKERKSLTTRSGVTFQLLSRGMDFPCEFILNRWPPGTSTGEELYNHEGKECGLLLEGELIVETNGKSFHMKPGDSITLESSSPHRITNPGKKEAVAVWINSIPWLFSTK